MVNMMERVFRWASDIKTIIIRLLNSDDGRVKFSGYQGKDGFCWDILGEAQIRELYFYVYVSVQPTLRSEGL